MRAAFHIGKNVLTPQIDDTWREGGRLEFIDGLRGVTMILVVYWHVLVMSLHVTTYTAMTLQLVRMPLFFFISGFFAYSLSYDLPKLKKRLRNRLSHQLMPTLYAFIGFILFETLYEAKYTGVLDFLNIFGGSATGNAVTGFKSGYWFTFVIVEVFCGFAVLNYFLSEKRVSKGKQSVIFLTIALASGLLKWAHIECVTPQSPEPVKMTCEILSLSNLLRYQVFFYLGVIFRIYDKTLWRLLSRPAAGLAIVILTGVVFYFTPRFKVPLAVFYGAACTGILFSVTLFFYLRRIFTSFPEGRSGWRGKLDQGLEGMGRLLKYIGKNTLPIYLYHYFIIRVLRDVDAPWLASGIKRGAWLEIPVVMLMSLAIVLIVLGAEKGIKALPKKMASLKLSAWTKIFAEAQRLNKIG